MYRKVKNIRYIEQFISNRNDGKNKIVLTLYVTYNSVISVSLVILALDNLKINNSKIKASYGWTKFCNFSLKNQICPFVNCFFSHEISSEYFYHFDKNNEKNSKIKKKNN